VEGVPKWDRPGMGMVTDLGFVEDFVGFKRRRSSILGLAGLCVIVCELRFR
jgi:hypothetical protein